MEEVKSSDMGKGDSSATGPPILVDEGRERERAAAAAARPGPPPKHTFLSAAALSPLALVWS